MVQTSTLETPKVPARDGAASVPTPNSRRPRGRGVRTRRRLLYALLGAAALVLIALALRPTPVSVEVGEVSRGPILVTLSADGVTRVMERYTVAAPINGRVTRLTLHEGDVVEAGGVVAWLTPAPIDTRDEAMARAKLSSALSIREQAAARVEQARASAAQSAREAARRAELEAAGAISLEQLEQAQLTAGLRARELDAAEAAAGVADAEVTAARAALLSTTGSAAPASLVAVRAPVAGRVLRVVDPSERVVAAGSPLLEIGDATGLELVLDVLSTDAVSIAPAMPILVFGWGRADTLQGRVRYVEPAAFTEISALGVEEQRVNVVGDLLTANPSVGDGYRIEGAIVLSQAPDVVRAPTSALFEYEGGWGVFVVQNERALLREVEIGRRGQEETEILEGLSPGEVIVRYPSDQLSNRVRVRT